MIFEWVKIEDYWTSISSPDFDCDLGLKEDFVNNSLTDRFEKLEDLLDVINKRAKGIFLLMEYISKNKQDK
jgi:hypothetical protein